MKKTVFEVGDLVESNKTAHGYNKQDIFKIVDARGLHPGVNASRGNSYWAHKLSKGGKSWDSRRWAIYHIDLEPVIDRKIRVSVVELEVKDIDERKKKLLGELEYLKLYKSDDEYRDHLVKKIIKTPSVDKIRDILMSTPEGIL